LDELVAGLPAAAAIRWRVLEAVFSSSEDRIPASQATVRTAGISIVRQQAESGVESARIQPSLPYRSSELFVRAAASLFTVLFPSDCRICSTPLTNISRLPVCEECLDQVLPLAGDLCSVCGERMPQIYSTGVEADIENDLHCPTCRRLAPPYTKAVAYGSYDGNLRELVHLLKYGGVRPAANILGRMVGDAISKIAGEFDRNTVLVIPVPLHKSKRRQRGFNQAELIARAAVKHQKAPGGLVLAVDLLRRQRDTKSQIGLTSHQRRANMRGAFTVVRPGEVKGREVLLVDDVVTTGTTVSECARVLLRAGAVRVWVATAARTLKTASQYSERKPPGSIANEEDDSSERAIG
jgi:ComF family protein